MDLTGRIGDRLVQDFPDDQIIQDIDTFLVGVNFEEQIRKYVSDSEAVIVVIDNEWLSIKDDDGGRRIDRPGDYVRFEIETALEMGIPTVPLLLNEAPVPDEKELPECLKPLSKMHGQLVRTGRDFHRDMDRVVEDLRKHADRQREARQKVREFREVEAHGNWLNTWIFTKDVLEDDGFTDTVVWRVLNEERDRLEQLAHLAQCMKDREFEAFLQAAEAVEVDSAVLDPLIQLAKLGIAAVRLSQEVDLEAFDENWKAFVALLHDAPSSIEFALPDGGPSRQILFEPSLQGPLRPRFGAIFRRAVWRGPRRLGRTRARLRGLG